MSLHDEEGYFPPTNEAALKHADTEEARAECRAQIETALAWGVDVTHLDPHMGVIQGRRDLYEMYLDLAEEFRLPIRMFPRATTERLGFDPRAVAEARGALFNEQLVFPWPRRTRDVFFEEIPKLPPGVSEIFAHPVLEGEELRAYDPDNADIRAQDAACLIDPSVSALLETEGIKRISFRALRDLQREG